MCLRIVLVIAIDVLEYVIFVYIPYFGQIFNCDFVGSSNNENKMINTFVL